MKDGGPAFPVECQWRDGELTQGVQTGNAAGWHVGMSLRDYFAAKAMAARLGDAVIPSNDAAERLALLARGAYAMADAMLKAREQ